MKAIKMRLAGIPMKEVMEQLNIRNNTQLKTWIKWYRNGELNRLEQPVGKQYTYGKGPEYASELEQIKVENRFLKQQLDVLKSTGRWKGGFAKDRSGFGRVDPWGSQCHTSM